MWSKQKFYTKFRLTRIQNQQSTDPSESRFRRFTRWLNYISLKWKFNIISTLAVFVSYHLFISVRVKRLSRIIKSKK